tara:strand:- start:3405 stop:3992 length:588 start_codon:yes stop_codon:yes gene_type:complete
VASKYKEYSFPQGSFMKGWYIDPKVCDFLITLFKENKDYVKKGHINSGDIRENIKDSEDLFVSLESTHPLLEEYNKNIADFIKLYEKNYPELANSDRYGLIEDFNVQHYKPQGGFKTWHYERCHVAFAERVLVFMTYLNDVPDGGTMFKYQDLIVPAKKGLTLIWPTDFTHTHKGQISQKCEKYIATGWLHFIKD